MNIPEITTIYISTPYQEDQVVELETPVRLFMRPGESVVFQYNGLIRVWANSLMSFRNSEGTTLLEVFAGQVFEGLVNSELPFNINRIQLNAPQSL